MKLVTYLKTLSAEARARLAEKAGTSREYLVQLAGGHRLASPNMAKRIELASGGVVTRQDLRSDIWGDEAA